MRPQTIADMLRPAARQWAEKAPLEELAAYLPAKLLFKIQVGQAGAPESKPGNPLTPPAVKPTKRRRRKLKLSKKLRQTLTERLAGVKYGTPEYQKLRDELVKELGITPRQVSSFARQMKPSRRKK